MITGNLQSAFNVDCQDIPLVKFSFPELVLAKYVKFVAESYYGGSGAVLQFIVVD